MNWNNRFQQVESTVQDISQLGQILGDQVVRQSEQIEQLYFDALVATRYIGMGNEQVTKTISVTKAGTWYMFIFMMICTVLVLFFDWFHS